jgi:hypothetical protein
MIIFVIIVIPHLTTLNPLAFSINYSIVIFSSALFFRIGHLSSTFVRDQMCRWSRPALGVMTLPNSLVSTSSSRQALRMCDRLSFISGSPQLGLVSQS